MLAIIPARSGSKRIKNKNIKIFKGKPLIYWAIKILKKNKKIKKIIISSDSSRILRISKKYGADILIKRSKKISGDNVPFQEVIVDTIKKIKLKNKKKIIVLFPSSIFINNIHLNKAINLLGKNPNKFIISIGKYSHPIQRAYIIKKKKLIFLNKKYELTRTQDLKPTFFDVGQFYLGSVISWLTKRVHSNSIGVIIPKEKAIDIDIDTMEDWKFAQKISNLSK